MGSLPQDGEKVGDELHEEIVVRWRTYLQKGIGKQPRNELMDKYPIPKNCPSLRPPCINVEILECLNEATRKHDSFISAVQQQIGHALAAIGTVLNNMLHSNQTKEMQEIADAAQLLTNTHNALSVHRKYKITPQLSAECKKAVESSIIDKCLFGENFNETFKAAQDLKKVSGVMKKRQWQASIPSSSSNPPPAKKTRPIIHQGPHYQNYLNSQRIKPKSRMKERRGEERKYRWRKQVDHPRIETSRSVPRTYTRNN